MHAGHEFLWAFMIVATALVVVRTLIVIYLAYRFRRSSPIDLAEPASVVIAAYNEGKVIAATLQSLLKTDYQGELEIIVIDDGSGDDTAAEVERIAATDPRVRLVRQDNRGKARALQRGIATAKHELTVFIDGVTHCQRHALRHLLAQFGNPDIGGV